MSRGALALITAPGQAAAAAASPASALVFGDTTIGAATSRSKPVRRRIIGSDATVLGGNA